MKTIRLEAGDINSHQWILDYAHGLGVVWNPHPIIAYDLAPNAGRQAMHFRTVGKSALGGRFWYGLNLDMDHMIGGNVASMMGIAMADVPKSAEPTFIMEAAPIGGFVWIEGRSDEATLLIHQADVTGHELLTAFDAFLKRREKHGDGIDTRTHEPGEQSTDSQTTGKRKRP